MVRLHFEFHCTSEDNERGIASGHNDPSLSPKGQREAKELGERYGEVVLDAVYCSDLLRARQTAALAFGRRGVPVFEDPRLRECNYGRLNGAQRELVEASRVAHVKEPFPDGESYEQVGARVASLVAEIRERHDDRGVVMIGHHATYCAIERIVTGKSLEHLLAEPWKWMPVWRHVVEL